MVCRHKKGTWEKEERKRKDQGRQEGGSCKGKVLCALHQEFFFCFTSIWVWKRTNLVEVSAPTRLGLQGSHVQRKFRKQTTLRSESSTLKGLLYPPIKQEQYHKRTTLCRLKIPLWSVVARKAALLPWSEAWASKLSSDKQQSTFIHELEILWWFHAWAVLRSLANARKCQLKDFCEKERYDQSNRRSQQMPPASFGKEKTYL